MVLTLPPSGRKVLLSKALSKRKKVELVQLVLDLVGGDRRLIRELEERLEIDEPAGDLVEETLQAILDATKVDMKRLILQLQFRPCRLRDEFNCVLLR
ncbi:MAG: hypothetical protein RIK87_03050 [Fuerstiella sp.]